MKKAIKIFSLAAVLMGGCIVSNAQTARGLYMDYQPRKKAGPPKSGKTGPTQKPGPRVTASPGTTMTSTGLPGTKVIIELERGGKYHKFVRPDFNFRSGDKIRLRLQTNFDGYVSLINVGSTGEVRFLFPYEGANNRLVPSSGIQIPGPEAWIVFDDKVGTENLTVVMSKEPLHKSPDDYRSIRESNSRDLKIEYADDGVYAVCEEDKITGPVGFTLRLRHGK